MHIGLCIVSTKSTTKLKFLILRTGNKRMTRTDITRPFSSKSAEDLTMFFKCLLHLCSLTFRTGLFLIYLRQHRTQRTTVHSSACFILKTTIVEIEKWTLKLIRLVETSSRPFSLFVNSQLFIHASHLSFIVHFLIMHSFFIVVWAGSGTWVPYTVSALLSVPQVESGTAPIPWLHPAICSWTYQTVMIVLTNIEFFDDTCKYVAKYFQLSCLVWVWFCENNLNIVNF
jgi:hypothetical protein